MAASPTLRAHRDLAQAEAYLCRTCGRVLGPWAVRQLHARSAGGPEHHGHLCKGSVTPGALLPLWGTGADGHHPETSETPPTMAA